MRYRVQELKRPTQDPVGYYEVREMDEERFCRWALAACGGGYTARQTQEAMVLKGLVDTQGKAYLRDFVITLANVGADATLPGMHSDSTPQERDIQSQS